MNNEKLVLSCLSVKKTDLAQLATEITQLKDNLPKVLTKQLLTTQSRLQTLEDENGQLRKQCDGLNAERDYWKSRYETAIRDTQTEKQECLKLRCEQQDLSQQLTQQSEYCSVLGSSCCSLLWRVSRQEDSIEAMLTGSKVDEFLSLVKSTLQSYLAAYKDDWPAEMTTESYFILALCGVVTNIAATAYGREFLCSNVNGRKVVDVYVDVLSDAPPAKSARLKNLLLMSLYNLTLNQKGLKYLQEKATLIPLCSWLLQSETDGELRVNCLRLLQSFLYDTDNINAVHQLREVMTDEALEQLCKDVNKEVRDLSLEILNDMRNSNAGQ